MIIQNGTIRKFGYGFLFAFYSNYGFILHQYRDKARYWSKIVIFHDTLAFGALVRRGGGHRWNITIPFGMEKLEWWGYPMAKKTLTVTVYTQYRRVTDRPTNRHLATA